MSSSKAASSHLELGPAIRNRDLMKAGATLVHLNDKGFLNMSLKSPKFSELSY